MNDQEKIMSVLAQGYQVLSKAMKQQPSKEGFQQVLQMLGDDGIQACVQVAEQGPEAVAQTMAQVIQEKQTQKAAKGTKLNRLMALNNNCPEGYMKKGGKCKKCEKGNKFDKGAIPTTSYFKDGGIQKKQAGGGFNWAQAAQATAEAVGNGITAMYDWKKQKKYLDTIRDINNSNNNTQIAMAGAQNDLAMANMRANTELQSQQFINNNKRNRFTGYQPTWLQN